MEKIDIKELKEMTRYVCKHVFGSNCHCSNFKFGEIVSYVRGFIDGYLVCVFGTFDVSYHDVLFQYANDYLLKLYKKEFGSNVK